MVDFIFQVNKSFLQSNQHPVTIPKSQVDYSKIDDESLYTDNLRIICPNGKKLGGKIYYGIAGYGPYYQIRVDGYLGDPLYNLTCNQDILIQIYKEDSEVWAKFS